jgi:hypothetical protein
MVPRQPVRQGGLDALGTARMSSDRPVTRRRAEPDPAPAPDLVLILPRQHHWARGAAGHRRHLRHGPHRPDRRGGQGPEGGQNGPRTGPPPQPRWVGQGVNPGGHAAGPGDRRPAEPLDSIRPLAAAGRPRQRHRAPGRTTGTPMNPAAARPTTKTRLESLAAAVTIRRGPGADRHACLPLGGVSGRALQDCGTRPQEVR